MTIPMMNKVEEPKFNYGVSDQAVASIDEKHDTRDTEAADQSPTSAADDDFTARRSNSFRKSMAIDELRSSGTLHGSKHSLRQSLTLANLLWKSSSADEFGVSDLTMDSELLSSQQSILSFMGEAADPIRDETDNTTSATRRGGNKWNHVASRRERCASTNSSTRRFRSQAAKVLPLSQKMRPASLSGRIPRRGGQASRSNSPPQLPSRRDSVNSSKSLAGTVSRVLKSGASGADSMPRFPVRISSTDTTPSSKS